MKLELTKEQVGYFKSLDNQVDKKKFLLDAVIENLEADLNREKTWYETTKEDVEAVNRLEESKPMPLFTTEDGVDLYDGDSMVLLATDSFIKIESVLACENPFKGKDNKYKYFSSVEAAEQYILMNKPCLSLKVVFEEFDKYKWGDFKSVLEMFVKSKQAVSGNFLDEFTGVLPKKGISLWVTNNTNELNLKQ